MRAFPSSWHSIVARSESLKHKRRCSRSSTSRSCKSAVPPEKRKSSGAAAFPAVKIQQADDPATRSPSDRGHPSASSDEYGRPNDLPSLERSPPCLSAVDYDPKTDHDHSVNGCGEICDGDEEEESWKCLCGRKTLGAIKTRGDFPPPLSCLARFRTMEGTGAGSAGAKAREGWRVTLQSIRSDGRLTLREVQLAPRLPLLPIRTGDRLVLKLIHPQDQQPHPRRSNDICNISALPSISVQPESVRDYKRLQAEIAACDPSPLSIQEIIPSAKARHEALDVSKTAAPKRLLRSDKKINYHVEPGQVLNARLDPLREALNICEQKLQRESVLIFSMSNQNFSADHKLLLTPSCISAANCSLAFDSDHHLHRASKIIASGHHYTALMKLSASKEIMISLLRRWPQECAVAT